MLPLDDNRWSSLSHAYGACDDLLDWLRSICSPSIAEHVRSFDFWGSLCHQGGVCTATYAAVPHIVSAVTGLPVADRWRVELLHLVGSCAAGAYLPDAPEIPDFLQSSYTDSLPVAASLASQSMLATSDSDRMAPKLRHLFSTVAACRGFADLAFFVSEIDCSIECPSCDATIEALDCNLNPLAAQ